MIRGLHLWGSRMGRHRFRLTPLILSRLLPRSRGTASSPLTHYYSEDIRYLDELAKMRGCQRTTLRLRSHPASMTAFSSIQKSACEVNPKERSNRCRAQLISSLWCV
ncbi:hypothetical protein IW261DRAFT_129109 [Armillaria novae-zelandiae]|uniref:Uncharacterized protein n=1 Tax=Armillaria novae-zelandiae TaxID=153914 RepID=A0AA39PAN7_9AGAR|nr:hypothetical protein IW261DRAFT_129109 [Armillaria novae-zelandiae]